MRAYVLDGIGQLEYREVPMPQPGGDEVIVRVTHVGICGSDIPRIFKTGTYHFPTIPGHEFAGVVDRAGAEQYQHLVGKRVGVFPLIPCMQCEQCRQRKYEMCQSYNYLGSRTDGAFAEYVKVPVWNLIELPENVGSEDAAMLEPTCVALHAIRQADLSKVGSAAVYGCGTIGILVLQWLKAMGMTRVYAVGTREDQRKLVDEVSGASFCNCREEDPISFIMGRTDHRGVDIVFECVGVNESVNNAITSVVAGGQAVLVGNPAGDIVLEKQIYWKILRRQLTVYGIWNSSFTKDAADDWHTALKAIGEGKIHPAKQITHRFSFKEMKDGLEVMRDKHIFSNKVMIMI